MENENINFDESEKHSEKSNEYSFEPFYSSSSNSTSSNSSTSSSSSSSLSSSSSSSKSSKQHKQTIKKLGKNKYKKLSNKKMCSKALELIKFLGTLQMKKLELKHDPKLRRASFLEWISQLEVAFSSSL